MKKENLGIELIQARLDGLTQIWVDVECEDGYMTEVYAKIKIDLNNEHHLERQLKKVRKFVSMGKAMVTLNGIGESTYDKREFYRITNRWYQDVECRPLQNEFGIHHIEKVDTPLKSTNAIMKAIQILFDHVKEIQKEEN